MLFAAALPHLLEEACAIPLPYSVQYRVGCRIELVNFCPRRREPVSADSGVMAASSRTKQSVGEIIVLALLTHGGSPF
jgi:hypothetical protein